MKAWQSQEAATRADRLWVALLLIALIVLSGLDGVTW